jgi:hypothetical protein
VEQNKKGFSDSDRAALDQIVKDREHRQWLIDGVKRWAQWIAAVIIGVKFAWDALADLVRKLLP